MRKSILFLILFIVALGFFTCKKDEVVNSIKIGLVTQVFISGNINRTIDYNASNRPTKMTFYTTTGYPDGYQTYNYKDDSLVNKISVYNQQNVLTSYTTYEYDNTSKRLLTKRYYTGNSVLLHSEAYAYNIKNQAINYSDFDSAGYGNYSKTQIFDTLEDPTEVKYYKTDNSYVGSLFYTYDDKPSVFALYYKNLGLSHPNIKHNITNITSSLTPVGGKVTIDVGKYQFVIPLCSSSFEYDKNNLPTKEIRNYLDGTKVIETYEYK